MNQIEMKEIITVCRLCGKSADSDNYNEQTIELVDVFHDQELASIIKQLFSIKIKKTTNISTLICSECLKLTKEFYSFTCLVKETQKKFGPTQKDKKSTKTEEVLDIADFNLTTCKEENSIKEENIADDYEANLEDIPLEIQFNDDNEDVKLAVKSIFPISNEETNAIDSDDEKLNNLKKVKYESEDSDWIVSESGESESDESNSADSDLEDSFSENSESNDEKPLENKSKSSKLKTKSDKKHKKKSKRKLSRSSKFIETNIFTLEQIENKEMFKNGKLVMKKPEVDVLISKFYNLQCDICETNSKFKNLWDLSHHFTQKHNTKAYVICCGARHRKRKYIVSHMARHLQPSAFECPVCKKFCAQPNLVENHMKTHMPAAERSLKCEECNKIFVNAIGLKRHKLMHISEDKKSTFTCNVCGKSYNLYLSYKAHISTAHKEITNTCPECGKNFTTKGNLDIHMWLHDKEGTHQVTCEQCGIMCKNKIYYKHHIRRMHTTKQFKCTMCDYSTYYQAKLKEHMFVKHTDNKPFICVVCGKRFKLKKVMETHMALHTGERKYACKFCPKTFASSGNCHKHQKRIHLKQINDKSNADWSAIPLGQLPIRDIYQYPSVLE